MISIQYLQTCTAVQSVLLWFFKRAAFLVLNLNLVSITSTIIAYQPIRPYFCETPILLLSYSYKKTIFYFFSHFFPPFAAILRFCSENSNQYISSIQFLLLRQIEQSQTRNSVKAQRFSTFEGIMILHLHFQTLLPKLFH